MQCTEKKRKKEVESIEASPLHLRIYLRSHDDHPDQKDESDDPEGENGVPFVANGVLFQPCQGIEGYTMDFVICDVGVAG